MIELLAGILGCTLLTVQLYGAGIAAHNESSLATVLEWLKSLDARIDRLEQSQPRRKNDILRDRD